MCMCMCVCVHACVHVCVCVCVRVHVCRCACVCTMHIMCDIYNNFFVYVPSHNRLIYIRNLKLIQFHFVKE